MDKKGELSLGAIVIMFMGIIIGLAFIPMIFNTQSEMTTKLVSTNESVTILGLTDGNSVNDTKNYAIANVPSGWKIAQCPITGFTLTNSSGDAFTVTTDYTVDATYGNFTMVNNTDTITIIQDGGNETLIGYTHCADGYNTGSGSRGVARLIGLFSAFVLLAFVLQYIRKEFV